MHRNNIFCLTIFGACYNLDIASKQFNVLVYSCCLHGNRNCYSINKQNRIKSLKKVSMTLSFVNIRVLLLQEGFNAKGHPTNARTRLGFIANQENSCYSPDSFVGLEHDTSSTQIVLETLQVLTGMTTVV